jgi:hypothetical protein
MPAPSVSHAAPSNVYAENIDKGRGEAGDAMAGWSGQFDIMRGRDSGMTARIMDHGLETASTAGQRTSPMPGGH